MWKEVLFRKPDLDTLVCALVCDVRHNTPKRVVFRANEEELSDPEILCIEVGGSGRVDTNNFDHHDPERDLPPACVQAWNKFRPYLSERLKAERLQHLELLVRYAREIDEGLLSSNSFPALSHIISGILLVEKDPILQFEKGFRVLLLFHEENLDPYSSLKESNLIRNPEIQIYLEAKKKNLSKLKEDLSKAIFFTTRGGLLVGALVTDAVGGHKTLYERGAKIVILYNPVQRKFTISGNEIPLNSLLEKLSQIEEGWGGRRTIIGSPITGSKLDFNFVVDLVKKLY